MSPRAYTMGRRSQKVAQTRARIVAAAAGLFAERGARGTTMTEVARCADVSTATVTNHFATPEALLEAVIEHLEALIRVPDEGIFEGAKSVPVRLRVLTEAMFDFFDRTEGWFNLLGAELTEVPAVARAQASFWRSMKRLYARALKGNDNPMLAKATAGLIHPSTLGALRSSGLSTAQAAQVVADSLTHLARTRRWR